MWFTSDDTGLVPKPKRVARMLEPLPPRLPAGTMCNAPHLLSARLGQQEVGWRNPARSLSRDKDPPHYVTVMCVHVCMCVGMCMCVSWEPQNKAWNEELQNTVIKNAVDLISTLILSRDTSLSSDGFGSTSNKSSNKIWPLLCSEEE